MYYSLSRCSQHSCRNYSLYDTSLAEHCEKGRQVIIVGATGKIKKRLENLGVLRLNQIKPHLFVILMIALPSFEIKIQARSKDMENPEI